MMLKALLIGLAVTVAMPALAQSAPVQATAAKSAPTPITSIQTGTLLDRPGQSSKPGVQSASGPIGVSARSRSAISLAQSPRSSEDRVLWR